MGEFKNSADRPAVVRYREFRKFGGPLPYRTQ